MDYEDGKGFVSESIDSIQQKFERWKQEKTATLKFLLIKEYALPPRAEVEMTSGPAKSIVKIRISDRGLISTFEISADGIKQSTESVNDENVRVIEESIAKNHYAAVQDYFHDHPEDIPE